MRAETGMSIAQYVRHRRMQRALHLLRYSDLPIKQIGEAVGVPDPHFFNKLVRRAFGRPPREIRKGHLSLKESQGEKGPDAEDKIGQIP
jgi:transcriptional regulator GlxA family with amidase domain